MRGLYPARGIVALSALALLGCSGVSTGPRIPATGTLEVVETPADNYALSPPPELILPRDEPLTGAPFAEGPPVALSQPPAAGDLWARLRGGLSLPRDRLEVRDTARRMAAGRNHLDATLERGQLYLWHVVREVEARGMPVEIALLPAIESAYDPYAYSPSHAVGLWQFLPGTAERFGLRRNWWYDGRRDVTESTRAALDYLEYLHGMFGDWLLALAAYNSGEGRVQQALQNNRARGLPEDFWSISLPTETRGYVPRLLALAELLDRPEHYGYTLPPMTDEPRFEMVDLPGQVELERVAGLIDLDPKDLYRLNPGYGRWATDPQGPHRLLVPQGRGERLRQALATLPPDSLVSWHQYVTQEGDSLSSIARRYGVQTALLQEVNNLSGQVVMAGTTLRIPRAPAHELPVPELASRRTAPASITYVIRPGDSLWRIAQQHGVRVTDLVRWNNLSPSATLQPGRTLVIRSGPRTTDT
ncbi:MAG TPA: LysM peptidoglycan-binding domain-containing protein [Nevskiales bacterium]|nr:LysM peptidoglycan-binding domain-containing protein [Nevskiales bacterium]